MIDSEHYIEDDCVEMVSECGIKLYLEFPKQAEANDIKVLQEAREILSGMLKESLTRSKGGLLHEESADPVKSKL